MTEHSDAPVVCDHRGCVKPGRERLFTGATQVTFIRTALALAVALYAAYERSLPLLLVALATYWVGDIADGVLARRTDSETRIGAVLDIASDRLCAGAIYIGLAWLDPTMVIPIGIYLFQFAVVDTFLSLAFLAWPLTSPNYFYLVDATIWRWNWSKLGKAVNSSLFAILLVVTGSVPAAVAVAVCLSAVKVWSLLRLVRLGMPVPSGCAVTAASAQARRPLEQDVAP